MTESMPFAEGACTCGAVRFALQSVPIFVNCCHCRWCQRETGSAFALNALIETDRVQLLQGRGEVEAVPVPSASGKGQTILRCRHCHVALWSHYPGGGPQIAFVRVGTLEPGPAITPDAHIHTATKQPWVVLGDAVPAFAEYYDPKTQWPAESLQRYRAAKAGGS